MESESDAQEIDKAQSLTIHTCEQILRILHHPEEMENTDNPAYTFSRAMEKMRESDNIYESTFINIIDNTFDILINILNHEIGPKEINDHINIYENKSSFGEMFPEPEYKFQKEHEYKTWLVECVNIISSRCMTPEFESAILYSFSKVNNSTQFQNISDAKKILKDILPERAYKLMTADGVNVDNVKEILFPNQGTHHNGN